MLLEGIVLYFWATGVYLTGGPFVDLWSALSAFMGFNVRGWRKRCVYYWCDT